MPSELPALGDVYEAWGERYRVHRSKIKPDGAVDLVLADMNNPGAFVLPNLAWFSQNYIKVDYVIDSPLVAGLLEEPEWTPPRFADDQEEKPKPKRRRKR